MSYGRNFEFRVHPHGGERAGRYAVTADFPIGAPAKTTGSTNALGLATVAAADDGAPPVPGKNGIVVFEHINYNGDDPLLTTYSDKGDAPAGKAVQLVSGTDVKVVLRNTEDRTFLTVRDYEGRTMVAGLGATPTVSVGDYLEPHSTPSDSNGYWQETSTLANAWLVVTKVDLSRGEVEARMLF